MVGRLQNPAKVNNDYQNRNSGLVMQAETKLFLTNRKHTTTRKENKETKKEEQQPTEKEEKRQKQKSKKEESTTKGGKHKNKEKVKSPNLQIIEN